MPAAGCAGLTGCGTLAAVARVADRYNGLNWRIEKFADTSMPPDGDLNQRREMYYSANWQLLEERIDDDALAQYPPPEVNRHMIYVWGPRYIDDIVARKQTDLSSETETVWYHLTDAQFSTVAIIDDNANLVERISYDAYGVAKHHWMGDVTGDGAVGLPDRDLLGANNGNFGVGDLNRDGIVDSTDAAIVNVVCDAALPIGRLTRLRGGVDGGGSGGNEGTDNIIGYAGYIFNPESPGARNGGLYTVRHRHYEPGLGPLMKRSRLAWDFWKDTTLRLRRPSNSNIFSSRLDTGADGPWVGSCR